jgi:hypothetical protein
MEAIDQVVQVGGALLILAAFILAQVGRLETGSVPYLGLNLVGSAILAIDAAIGAEWGFLLLEGVWAIVSAAGLARALRRSPASPG